MSKEVKPICVVYYDPNLVFGQSVFEMNVSLQNKFNDYHVLAIPSTTSRSGDVENLRLQVFHPKDFTETDYKSLETLIHTALEEIKNKQL